MALNENWSDMTSGSLSFTGISVTETDTGSVNHFVGANPVPLRAGAVPTVFSSGFTGLQWSAFASGATAPGSTTTLAFSYDVTASPTSGLAIASLQQAFTADTVVVGGASVSAAAAEAAGLTLTATEYVYDSAGDLVGQSTIDLANPNASGVTLAAGAAFTSLHVDVVVQASVAAGVAAPATVNFSVIDQGFHTVSTAGLAALGDYVWADTNDNGVQDSTETGVGGVTVNLLDSSGNFTGLSTTTDSTGYYHFTGLAAGVYEVQFVPPVDYTFSPTGAGTPATDSNPNPTTGITGPITLVAGQNDITIDAGLVPPSGSHDSGTAALGDYVWEDANDNGVQDSGETGIANVTVNLLDSTGSTVLATTTTDSTGYYHFTNLMAGQYEVQFVAPTGYDFSPTGAGTPATDSNPDQGTGITSVVTLAIGQVDNTIDAGLYRPAALGDYVFQDVNGNGIQDAGDTGIANVTVNLLDSTGSTVLGTTTTDSTGYYHFTGLTPGVYEVQFVAPSGDSFTLANQGSNPAVDSNANQTTGITAPITLVSGQTDNTIDAGIIVPPPPPPPTGKIGDFVWFDCNGNGIQNAGETGVANVTVNLLDSNGNQLATTTTSSTGYYLFSGLNAGVYQVQFVAPTGDTFTAAYQGTNRATDSNANTTSGLSELITLAAGASNLTIDAGLITTPNTAKLGDYVFQDCNGNGIQDAGESGIACVTVKLLNASGNVIRTTTTDSTGHYLFSNLAAGTYEVQFVAPSGYGITKALQGSNTALDSNPNQSTGITGPITLAAGQADLTIDAGMYKPACLGNLVFNDCNGNGIQDWNDTGVAGVTVKLLSGDGSTVLATTTTNSCGLYSFTNLIPGVYEVQFIAPAGKAFTIANAGGSWCGGVNSDANQSTGITGPITLTCGECDTSVDAGLITAPKGSIGDFVWCDSNRNGIQDSGENGIAGVTVKLLNATGTTVLATTTTDSSGHYLFGNLSAGTYEVQFVNPTGYSISPSLQGSNTAIDSNAAQSTGITGPITLAAGQNNLTIDEGLYKTSSGGGGGCGGWTYHDTSGSCGGGSSGGWGGSSWGCGYGGGYYGGGGDNCSYGSYGGGSWCGGYGGSYGGGGYGGSSGGWTSCGNNQYTGGGSWGCTGWNGSGWTNGWDDCTSGPGELGSICGRAQNVQFTYHHSDCVSSDALSCGVGSSWGHNGQSSCFIQITTSRYDHGGWGNTVLCQGTLHDGDKIQTDAGYDLTNCGGQVYAHIYASQADCQAGRSAIQEISFDCSGGRNLYLGQQVGSLCLTGYDGTHGTACANW